MIIRNIGFLVCMLVVCSLNINTAMAQSRSYEGGITVNPVRLEQKGDFVFSRSPDRIEIYITG